jgi:signal transduction histidine kinase
MEWALTSANSTQELGGRIEVTSVEGKGSTFRVYLPQSSEEAQQSLTERGLA